MKKYTLENFESFITKYSILTTLFSNDELVEFYKEWRFSNSPLFHDYIWSLFNRALFKNAENFSKTGNEDLFYQNNYTIYLSMGHFRREEGGSLKSVNQYIRLGFESNIDSYKNQLNNSRFDMNVILISNGSCEYAKNLNGKLYEVDEFLNECEIATDKCTAESNCKCAISLSPKRDENNRLIRK